MKAQCAIIGGSGLEDFESGKLVEKVDTYNLLSLAGAFSAANTSKTAKPNTRRIFRMTLSLINIMINYS